VVLVLACAPRGPWHSERAGRPLTRAELAVRPVTVVGDAPQTFAQALQDAGYRVVAHPAYRGDLEASLVLSGDRAVATLRTDGFFVAETEGPEGDLAALVRQLAESQGMADYIRNSGVPAQLPILVR
jgi:hypothetical protein